MKTEITSQENFTNISLDGRFDRTCSRDFREAILAAIQRNPTEIRIDLDIIEYMDSSALGMLLMAKEMAESVGKTVSLANAKGTVRKVLDFAKFKSFFEIV